MSDDLTDLVYEAAFIPEKWRDVCRRLAEVTDSYSAAFLAMDPHGVLRWASTPEVDPIFEAYSRSDMRFQNVRPMRKLASLVVGFERDLDIMRADEIEADPIRKTFMEPYGLGWSMGDVVAEPSGHVIVFDIMRETERGPYDPTHLDRLVPHRAG